MLVSHKLRYSAADPGSIRRFDVPLDENGFVDWLIDAEPGARIAYYRGHLGYDRMASVQVLENRIRIELNALACRVMAAESQGLVHLVQKRIGPEDYAYIAVKALRPRKVLSAVAATPAAEEPIPAVEQPAMPVLALAA